jgi:dTDP-4-dehydrorhamnose 3,5-epimerase
MGEIAGVKIQPLKTIKDERGFVKHMLRTDSPMFAGFGEIYFSYTNYRVIKAWKCHEKLTQTMAVPQGDLLLVIYDARPDSSTLGAVAEVVIGDENYSLIQIPPGLIYGFQSISPNGTLIANCLDKTYQASETKTIPIDSMDIPYQWQNKDV